MMIYVQVDDSVNQEKKNSMAGQMSLFDFVARKIKKIMRSACRMWRI